jgi:Flp pilus assembly pilin Flp
MNKEIFENNSSKFWPNFWTNFWTNFWNDEEGQSTTEYILILAIVAMVAMKMREPLEKLVTGILSDVGGTVQRNIRFD